MFPIIPKHPYSRGYFLCRFPSNSQSNLYITGVLYNACVNKYEITQKINWAGLSPKALTELRAVLYKDFGDAVSNFSDADIASLGLRFLKLTAVVLKRDVKR